MIHDARIVPLDGRPQAPPHMRSWLGSSRGRWDRDTLVVESTNFTDQTSFRGSDQHLRVVERFTREGPDALHCEYTIDNPTAFTRLWTAAFTMTPWAGSTPFTWPMAAPISSMRPCPAATCPPPAR